MASRKKSHGKKRKFQIDRNSLPPIAIREAKSYIRKVPRLTTKTKRPKDIRKMVDFCLPCNPKALLQKCILPMCQSEMEEMREFATIYFLGKASDDANEEPSYDDATGDYNIEIGTHICYRYEIIKKLGSGSFGQVVQCYDHKDKNNVAIKIIKNKAHFHRQALSEIKILRTLRQLDVNNSAGIIHLLDSFEFRNHLCMIFKLMGINLFESLQETNYNGIGLHRLQSYAFQIALSLQFLSKHNIMHCDLKPENILLDHQSTDIVKLIDFGTSCFMNNIPFTYIQSRYYRAPEVLLDLKLGPAIDMWSFGCILAELFTGDPIFAGENASDQLSCIISILGNPPIDMLVPSKKGQEIIQYAQGSDSDDSQLRSFLKSDDDDFIDFVHRCLQWNPKCRITPMQCLQHPWIQSHIQQEKHYDTDLDLTSINIASKSTGQSNDEIRLPDIVSKPHPPTNQQRNMFRHQNKKVVAVPCGTASMLLPVAPLAPRCTSPYLSFRQAKRSRKFIC